MELAFIWVSEFRNIINQGFNISSKFHFKYDHEKNFLSIESNPKYIPDFFGKDITNITGIVGQNAAGKTNLLELINFCIDGGNTKIGKPFFIVFENANSLFAFQNKIKDDPICSYPITFNKYSIKKDDPISVYFSNTFDGRSLLLGKKTINLSVNQILQVQFGQNIFTNLKEEIKNQIKFITSNDFKYLIDAEKQTNPDSPFKLMPEGVLITPPSWSNIISRAKRFDNETARILKIDNCKELSDFCKHFKSMINAFPSDKSFLYNTAFLIYIDFALNEFAERYIGFDKEIMVGFSKNVLKKPAKSFEMELPNLMISELKESDLDEVFAIITKRVSEYIDKEFPYSDEKSRFLQELGYSEFNYLKVGFEGLYSSKRINFQADFNSVHSFISRYISASTNLNLTYSFEWQGISSGHKAFLNLFSRFYSIKDKIKSDNIIICIDEGDLYFHPKWQTEFLYKIVSVLPKIFKKKKMQFILTTHSPFLISDLPKDNIIFLEKKENGQCHVIPNEKIEGETFGGNIGELYLDAFMLNGSLISFFAAKKIKELIDRVKDQKEYSKTDLNLLNSLGHKIIKQRIEFLHNDTNR